MQPATKKPAKGEAPPRMGPDFEEAAAGRRLPHAAGRAVEPGPRPPPLVQRFMDETFNVGAFLRQYLRQRAAIGQPQVRLADLLLMTASFYECEPGLVQAEVVQQLGLPGFLEHRRLLEGAEVLRLYSLASPDLTYETLVWAIKSVCRSCMRPSDKLVYARLKEVFGVQLGVDEWKELVRKLYAQPALVPSIAGYSPALGELEIRRFKDSYEFGLRGLSWNFDDQDAVSDNDADYRKFVAELTEFLSEPYAGQQPTDAEDKNELVVWTCADKEQKGPRQRAVQGGNYGCAFFMRVVGSPGLQRCSLGRLCAFVRHAIERQVLTHQKMLVTLNRLSPSRSRALLLAQRRLLDLLRAHPEGLSLSHLPALLAKAFGSPFDHSALGFPKFKHFVQSLDDQIVVVQKSVNHSRVFLKGQLSLPKVLSADSSVSLGRPSARVRLLLQLSDGREYEQRASALLYHTLAELPASASLAELEARFKKELKVPLDLMTVCASSVRDFIVRKLQGNPYLPDGDCAAPLAALRRRLAPPATPLHELSGPADKRGESNLSTQVLPPASEPDDEPGSSRELAKLHHLLNDDF